MNSQQQQHSQAIRLNNAGVSLLANGRGREATAYFAKSLGMIKALLSEQHQETAVMRQQQQQQQCSSPMTNARPRHQNQQCTHHSEMSSLTASSSSLAIKQNNNTEQQQHEATRTSVLQYHKTVSLAGAGSSYQNNKQPQEELFLTYQNAFLLQDPTETMLMGMNDDDDADQEEDAMLLTSHSACIIFNMALLHQRLGSLDKAEQLYRLVIQVVLQGRFVTSFALGNSSSNNNCGEEEGAVLDGTCLLVMLATLNNVSYLLYFDHQHQEQPERVAEASRNIQFLSHLLNIAREDMLFYDVVSEAEWSTFCLNAWLADPQSMCQQAAPAA
jgi:hypothetical protein